MKKGLIIILVLTLATLPFRILLAGNMDQGFLVFEPEGNVSIKVNDREWKPLTTSRLLKNGCYLKTGSDSSAKIRLPESGTVKTLGSNGLVVVRSGQINVLSGKLVEGKFWQKLAEVVKKAMERDSSEEKMPPVPIHSDEQPTLPIDE